ncbi:MAG: rod shape-determining protein MreC [Gammaproteobacteria bacterium]|nr:rod shape-determining protein MreC [Gammaproteobacteria bacterium]
MKPLFSFGPSLTAKLIIFTIISIGLMTIDHRFDSLYPVRSVLSLIVHPMQSFVDLPVKASRWLSENLTTRQQLLKDNRKLRSQQMLQNARLQKLSSLGQENIRLRELLTSASRFKEERVSIAELLSVDLDPYKQQVVISKGDIDGVYVGQPLLDANGVMGQITHVNAVSATALLISDPSHALPVQISRNGMRTLVVGTGKADTLSLRHIPASGDIQNGDIVNTSGLGGRFPPNYPVAQINHIERPPGKPFAIVTAKPFAHLDRSREVLLVWQKSTLATTLASGK